MFEMDAGDLTQDELNRIQTALHAEADRLRNITASFDVRHDGALA
jgi:hypothetical protein